MSSTLQLNSHGNMFFNIWNILEILSCMKCSNVPPIKKSYLGCFKTDLDNLSLKNLKSNTYHIKYHNKAPGKIDIYFSNFPYQNHHLQQMLYWIGPLSLWCPQDDSDSLRTVHAYPGHWNWYPCYSVTLSELTKCQRFRLDTSLLNKENIIALKKIVCLANKSTALDF